MKNSLSHTSVTMMVFFLYRLVIINEMINTALNFKIVEFTLFQCIPISSLLPNWLTRVLQLNGMDKSANSITLDAYGRSVLQLFIFYFFFLFDLQTVIARTNEWCEKKSLFLKTDTKHIMFLRLWTCWYGKNVVTCTQGNACATPLTRLW